MYRDTSAANPAMISQGRKRRRHRSLAGPEETNRHTHETFPRVVTAPANLAPSRDAAAAKASGRHTANSQRPSFGDTSDLEAQISTLALIRTFGYGPVPGTPLRRRNMASAAVAGGSGSRTGVHLDRDFVTSNATEGSSITGCRTSQASGKTDRGVRAKKCVGNGSTRTIREPWTGPLDSGGKTVVTTENPSSIQREELRRRKARSLAAVKGHYLLSQVGRVLHRRDLSTTAELLASARAEFRAAGDTKGASEVDEALIKIKADFVMQAIEGARKSRDYGRVQELLVEALHYFAILARHGHVSRHDTLSSSERRDADRRSYERLRQPRRVCREFALEDGRRSRQAAAALARKRMYTDARAKLDDARLCFNWAGGAEEELRKLNSVEDEVEMRENSTCGDRRTEGVVNKLQFLVSKNYSVLFSELAEAAKAYEIAKDQNGTKVVRLAAAALNAVLLAEQRWMQAADALKERKYFPASQFLGDAKRFISEATKGLPFVSLSLVRAEKILSPPGGLGPLDIVAELAALDGLKDHNKSVRALEQGMLDKSQQLNTSARELFEFTARCCRASSRCHGERSGGRGSRISMAGVSSSAYTTGGEKVPGGGRSGKSSLPASSGRGGTSAGKSVAEILASGDIEKATPLSDEQLNEGEALLFKIRRCTSPPTNPEDCAAFKPNPRASIYPGVRHRVEDLLDEVSETEDIITRKKALQRGDKLMAAFMEQMAANMPPHKHGPSLATTATAITRLLATADNISSNNLFRSWGLLSYRRNMNASVDAEKEKEQAPPAAAKAVGKRQQQVPGPGGALSAEAAETCLKLLADARDAYEGQGFAQQADEAARIRAELVADRCLVKVPALAEPTATAAASTVKRDGAGSSTGTTDGEPWLAPWVRGSDVDGLAAARAAAREAEENYLQAGNSTGALTAKLTEISLRADEAMVSVAPLLQKRAYEAVIESLAKARGLYTDAGPQGLEGLNRTRDPVALVKTTAMRDGKRLKEEAVRVLRDGDVEASRKLCDEAQRCFSFADQGGLADATADVHAAIRMVTSLASGDAVVAAAEAALRDGESEKAAQLLWEAKSFFHDAQLSYEGLVDQVTTLLEKHPDDLEVSQQAMQLQDNINGIYDSRRDGQRAVFVERRLDCLAADASLEKLAQVMDHNKFEDARTLLSAAARVYERSADQARLSKVQKISSLVSLVESASGALDENRYADAEEMVAECLAVRAVLAAEQPLCLRPPDSALLRGGGDGARGALLLRVRAAGDADRASALKLLEAGEFEAAERAASSACERYRWWAGYHPTADGGSSGAIGGGGGGGSRLGSVEADPDIRQAVLRAAKELSASIAAAADKARAEEGVREGRTLKSVGDFVAAVQTLKSAAVLFHGAGFRLAAAEARAEAAQTAAEALLLRSAELHREGKFEAIADQLENAEALLLEASGEAIESTAATTSNDAKPSPFTPVARGGGDVGGGDVVADRKDHVVGDEENGCDILRRTPSPAEALEDGGERAAARRLILEDLVNLRHRAAGDAIMRGVAPVLDARDYDRGLRLMLEAEDHFAAITAGRWKTTISAAVAAAAAAGGKDNASPLSPKELVTKRAAIDGDRLRAEAATAIQKEKNPAKARELLSRSEACMVWASLDPYAAGLEAVAKDIRIFESRKRGDEICKGLINLLREREYERATSVLEEALGEYRKGDAFNQIAETRAVAFCLEREFDLCAGTVSAVTSRNPNMALKVLEEARPVFQMAAELRSPVLREVAELMKFKHLHIVALSALCRAWLQCINGTPPSGDANSPDPAVLFEGNLSDIHKLIASGASVLDIPFDLLHEVCGSVLEKVAGAPKTPPLDAAPAGSGDPQPSVHEPGLLTPPDALRFAEEDDDCQHAESGRSGSDAQRLPPAEAAAGLTVENGAFRVPDRSVGLECSHDGALEGTRPLGSTEAEDKDVICEGALNMGSMEVEGRDAVTAQEAMNAKGQDRGADGSFSRLPLGIQSSDPESTPPLAQENHVDDGARKSSLLSVGVPPVNENPAPSRSSETVVMELATSTIRRQEGSSNRMGDVPALETTDKELKQASEDGVDGSRRSMSLSTQSGSVRETSGDPSASETGGPGDDKPSRVLVPDLESSGHIDDRIGGGVPHALQDSATAERPSVIVETSAFAHPLSSSSADREGLQQARGTISQSENTVGDLDESESRVDAPEASGDNDDEEKYAMDSDFGCDSGDGALPPVAAATATGTSVGALPLLETYDVGHKALHVAVDDGSDYPDDIDRVDDDHHSTSSGSDPVFSEDGSNSDSLTGGDEASSQSTASKGARGSASRSSNDDLSISGSENGDFARDGSNSTALASSGAVAVARPASDVEGIADQDDDDGEYTRGPEEPMKSVIVAPASSAQAIESHRGGVGSGASLSDAATPDSKSPNNADITVTGIRDHLEAPTSSISMNQTTNVALGDGCGVDAAEYPSNSAVDAYNNGYAGGKVAGESDDQTASAEPETLQADITKEENSYKPNLDGIDTSVDIGDLQRQFRHMLASSSSPLIKSCVADKPQTVGSGYSSAPPDYSAFSLPAEQPENGDALYPSINHGEGGATGAGAYYASGAEEHEGGDHNQYTQQEWDDYGEARGGFHTGAQHATSASVFADDALARAATQAEEHDICVLEHGDAQHNDLGRGSGRISEGQQAISDDSLQSGWDGQVEEKPAAASEEVPVVATGEGYGDEAEDRASGRQKQERRHEGDESDDMFDIGDQELSSSDDD